MFLNQLGIYAISYNEIHSMQFGLPDDARSRVKKVSVVRNLCHKVIIHSII